MVITKRMSRTVFICFKLSSSGPNYNSNSKLLIWVYTDSWKLCKLYKLGHISDWTKTPPLSFNHNGQAIPQDRKKTTQHFLHVLISNIFFFLFSICLLKKNQITPNDTVHKHFSLLFRDILLSISHAKKKKEKCP